MNALITFNQHGVSLHVVVGSSSPSVVLPALVRFFLRTSSDDVNAFVASSNQEGLAAYRTLSPRLHRVAFRYFVDLDVCCAAVTVFRVRRGTATICGIWTMRVFDAVEVAA